MHDQVPWLSNMGTNSLHSVPLNPLPSWPPKIYVLVTPQSEFDTCRDDFGVNYVLDVWAVLAISDTDRLREQVFTANPDQADLILAAQCFSHKFIIALQLCRQWPHSETACVAAETKLLNHRMDAWLDSVIHTPLHHRQNGTDFFVVTGAEDGRLAFPAFSHPAVRRWTFMTPMGSSSWLQNHVPGQVSCQWPHYPEFPWDVVLAMPSIHERGSTADQESRPRLAFFAGHNDSCARQDLFNRFACNLNGHGIVVCPGNLGALYGHMLRESKFCLVPDGRSSPWTWRFVEVIRAGCIPTVISDNFHPPFHRSIDWRAAAVFVRIAELPRLEGLLRAMPAYEITQRQQGLSELAEALDPRGPLYWELFVTELWEAVRSKAAYRGTSFEQVT